MKLFLGIERECVKLLQLAPQDLERRNLQWGAARPDEAPSKDVEYDVQKRDTTGFSRGFDVVGPDGRTWDIKIGKEAQTEIVLSRVLWALGYHQPSTYYMTGWKLAGEWDGEGEPARFRLESAVPRPSWFRPSAAGGRRR